jgi:dCTP deaminase
MIQSDRQIRLLSSYSAARDSGEFDMDNWKPMIEPFSPKQVREIDTTLGRGKLTERIISYGLSSFGYDVTLQRDFRVFSNVNSGIIDPLAFDEKCMVAFNDVDYCIIPPHSFALAYTREYFRIPNDMQVVVVGKSTIARCGGQVICTPIEAGFEGTVVIEIANCTSLPLKIYSEMGIAQFLFFRGSESCEVSYADRKGKYQGQVGIVTAKV